MINRLRKLGKQIRVTLSTERIMFGLALGSRIMKNRNNKLEW